MGAGAAPELLERARIEMKLGVAYPQIELGGDPTAVWSLAKRSKRWALTTSSPTTMCSAQCSKIGHPRSLVPTTRTTPSMIPWSCSATSPASQSESSSPQAS